MSSYAVLVDDAPIEFDQARLSGAELITRAGGGQLVQLLEDGSQREVTAGGFSISAPSGSSRGHPGSSGDNRVIEWRRKELELVRGRYGDIEVPIDLSWIVIPRFRLATGWNKLQTAVLVLIPPGYPVTPPDNFHTNPDLRLAHGGDPGNSGVGTVLCGRSWRTSSFHVATESWRPSGDLISGHNLLTFLLWVEVRLKELA